jgi:hypothetical protein
MPSSASSCIGAVRGAAYHNEWYEKHTYGADVALPVALKITGLRLK